MKVYDENITRLIRRWMTSEITLAEQRELDLWLEGAEDHRALFDKIRGEIQISSEGTLFNRLDEERAWQMFKTMTIHRRPSGKVVRVHRLLRYVGIVFLPLFMALCIWQWNKDDSSTGKTIAIHPGGGRAELIFDNGESYDLNGDVRDEIEVKEGIRVKQNGELLVYDGAAGQGMATVFNTLKIPRGGEFKLVLSDGTRVYLNSATSLKYPVVFDEKERKVYLSGEAYFEVAKEVDRPFYVVTDDVQVRVYGTEFNVNTYWKENIQTVLVNGKVGISGRGNKGEILMKPGELVSYNQNDGEFQVKEVDVRQYVAWKNGFFAFENETLEKIMSTLSLWYNVDVVFQSEAAKSLVFTGYMKRYEEIDEILNAITDVVGVTFTIKEQTIIISK